MPINQVPSDDESNYESPVDEDPSNLVSPNRPHQSPSASPRALLRPDPPPVEEVLQGVQQQLARDVRMAFEDEDGRDNANALSEAIRSCQNSWKSTERSWTK